MIEKASILVRFHRWRLRHLSERNFLLILSALIGIIAGGVATIIKNAVWFTQRLVNRSISTEVHNYIYFVLPVVGILLSVLFIKYIVKRPVRHGVPNVLNSISKRDGVLSRHNMFSSVITSALTVGFGGSVGLEGPTVATGASYGSWVAKFFRLKYTNVILLLGCACTGAMSAIFKAPIAGLVFAVEVIMIDFTTFSLVPLLLSSASAVVTSYFFLGQNVLYPFEVHKVYLMEELPYYILLGIFTGLISAYFTKTYIYIADLFEKIKKARFRLLFGGLSLGTIIFFFPALYGEGYESINECMEGNFEYLFNSSIFYDFKDSMLVALLLMSAIILFKVVATSLTFGSGGVGGIFAPSLFMGANAGMLFAKLFNYLGIKELNSNNFALIGMTGLIAGVLHAPLTGIFLIADISGGYKLFVPLMVTAIFAYVTTLIFTKNSVYHYQLARRKELITHDKDKSVLHRMQVNKLIENDFEILSPDSTLGDLTDVISHSHRNLFPIVDKDKQLKGMLKMDDVRHLIFKQELYDKVKVADLMYMPEYFISPNDTMSAVAEKFESSGRFNIAVIDNGKYLGFISRARVFSLYRKNVRHLSHD